MQTFTMPVILFVPLLAWVILAVLDVAKFRGRMGVWASTWMPWDWDWQRRGK